MILVSVTDEDVVNEAMKRFSLTREQVFGAMSSAEKSKFSDQWVSEDALTNALASISPLKVDHGT